MRAGLRRCLENFAGALHNVAGYREGAVGNGKPGYCLKPVRRGATSVTARSKMRLDFSCPLPF